MIDRTQRTRELFEAAVALSPADRGAYLDRACGGDPSLRAEVERVLAADAAATGFLESPIPHAASVSDPLIGRRIGRFRIKRCIGSGGMGTVYEAIQDQPERSVALKVLRADRVRAEAITRFAHESEILARLQHAGVAQIYEAGTYAEGGVSLPYFAMEYLPDALPITRFASDRSATLPETLELFARACAAVQYGHQRGVIHRDLKPANILVVEEETAPGRGTGCSAAQPKIIDFGVARVTRTGAEITSTQTEPGTYVGTLTYMSPEQCMPDADLDTRSDVYSLGVVLFQMLTGEMPYDVSGVPPFEIPRLVREIEPRRPSEVNRRLRGDLETIILTALEKDRERRYQTVAALEGDIRRFLKGDAIEAKADRRWYVLGKAMYRHRAAVGAAAVVLVASVAASLVSTNFWRQSERDRSRLTTVVTELELQQAETAEALERATQSERLAGDRLGEMTTFARDKLAELRESLGPEHDMTLKSMYDLSMLLKRHGALAEVEAIAREALEIYEERFGREHVTTLRIMGGLASNLQDQDKFEEAESLLRECLDTRRRVLGEDDRATLVSMNNYGLFLNRVDRPAEAETVLRECLGHRRRVFGESHPSTLSTMNNLANSYMDQGDFDKAVGVYRQVLDARMELLGPLDTKTMISTHNLGQLYRRFDRPAEGEPYLREAYDAARRVLPEGHWHTALYASHLGRCLFAMKRFDEAEAYLLEGYDGLRRALGDDHGRTRTSLAALIKCYEALEHADLAVRYRRLMAASEPRR